MASRHGACYAIRNNNPRSPGRETVEPTVPPCQQLSTAPGTDVPVEQATEPEVQSPPGESDAEWPRRKRELDALLASLDGG
jgi:hypothetical protein